MIRLSFKESNTAWNHEVVHEHPHPCDYPEIEFDEFPGVERFIRDRVEETERAAAQLDASSGNAWCSLELAGFSEEGLTITAVDVHFADCGSCIVARVKPAGGPEEKVHVVAVLVPANRRRFFCVDDAKIALAFLASKERRSLVEILNRRALFDRVESLAAVLHLPSWNDGHVWAAPHLARAVSRLMLRFAAGRIREAFVPGT